MVKKCLSLKQPYADLLVSGKKTIEVRKWNTKFRGQFLVHESKNINEEACKRLKIDQAKLVTGAIIGKANLYDVISYRNNNSFLKDINKHFVSSNYKNPKYGFLVKQAKRFDTPIPVRGKLGFFNVELNGFNLNGKNVWYFLGNIYTINVREFKVKYYAMIWRSMPVR